jgi:acyl transferase domain-containing protein/acyl-CoA synthetase (AMP-forming)/AMP-acid ligase II/acyl carrier protein
MNEGRTLVDALQRTHDGNPDRTALVFLENGEVEQSRLTAGELDRRARAIAATLQERASIGDRALLLYPSGPDFACAYVGCLYAGVVPVPCSVPPRQRADSRVTAVASDAGVRWVLTNDSLFSARDRCVAHHPSLADPVWIATPSVPDARAAEWARPAIDGRTLALLQYTSGSTSSPRGVMVTHQNLLVNIDDLSAPWPHDAGSVMVTWLPIFHDLGLIWGLLRPLVQGFTCVMMPPVAFLQRPARWLQAISRYRATHTGAPNFAYDLCAARVTEEEKQSLDLSSWRSALNGAEPIHAETLERFTRAFAPCGLPPTTMSPSYGLAEATLGVAMTPSNELSRVLDLDAASFATGAIRPAAPGAPGEDVVRQVSCGPLAPSVSVRIVDPVTLQACDGDRVGEIWLRGAAIAAGYWNNETATRETFGARVAGDNDGPYMRTGDLGFFRDGHLYVTGRHKDLIILHGLNYYPQDLELTVEHSHPALAHTGAAAFSVQDVEDEGDERVVLLAEVQRTALKSFDAAEVFAAIAAALLQEHGIAPWAISLIGPRMLPKTSSGKVRRAACRTAFVSGELETLAVWRHEQEAKRTPGVFSSSGIREWLMNRCAERLRVPRAGIDPRASFAMYGLTSLDAVNLANDLEERLGRPVSPTLLYDYPSIEALAAHLTTVGDSEPGSSAERPAPSAPEIAIVGLGCRFPGAANPDELWKLLRRGGDAIREMPEGGGRSAAWHDPTTPLATRAGGFLDEVDTFDASFFGVSPREAQRTDPQQRLMLEVAWEALEHAGIAPGRLAGTRTGVFVGISNSDYGRMLAAEGEIHELAFGTGSALSVAANRISYALDLRGPSMAIDTACSASLVAVTLAVQSLRRGECDAALAGGVNLILSPEYSIAFSNAQMLSSDGRCKTFAQDADGYGRGEGAGVVVLKRLADAQSDGDRILAVIRGAAINQDGRTAGLTAPNGPAQQAVVRAALHDAGVAPADIGYVEAHGTGTPLGDPIEVNSLAAVLCENRPADALCHIGSIKTNIGHLESAAGVAALIKTVLCLQHREIPPTLHCSRLNPRLEIGGTPVRVASNLISWDTGRPRIAGVSSFGFGGTNAHVIVQEHVEAAAPTAPPEASVLTLSARDPQALNEMAVRYIAALEGAAGAAFADACFTSNISRADLPERLAIVASSAAEACEALRAGAHESSSGLSPGHLHDLARTWREGARVDWDAVHAGRGRRKVSLPTYPFQRVRYWLPKTARPRARTTGSDVYRCDWVRADQDGASRAIEPQAWLIFADESGQGEALGRELTARGDAVVVARRGGTFSIEAEGSVRVRAAEPSDYVRAVEHAGQRLGGGFACVHLWNLDAADVATPETLAAALDIGAGSVVLLLQAMLGARDSRLWIVTREAQHVAGRSTDSGLLQSPSWGVGKSIAIEHPEHWGGLIDADAGTSVADVCEEIRRARDSANSDDHVAFRAGERFVARLVAADAPAQTIHLRSGAAYLITGGLGRLGLAVARQFALDGAKRLVLTSRSGPSTQERRQAIAALESSGVVVTAPALDVTDVVALRSLCRELAAQGTPVAGIVHAAGVAEQAPLRSISADAFRSVVRVKAAGALALRDATSGAPLDFFTSVSSIASAWGALDLSSYVAANAFLDVFAQGAAHRAPVTSIALGPVRGGLLPSGMARHMEEMGVSTWTPERAARTLLDLAAGRGHVIAADIDWARFIPLLETRGRRSLFDRLRCPEGQARQAGQAGHEGNEGHEVGAGFSQPMLTEIVEAEAAAILGLEAGQALDRHRGFFDLGMNSLMAVDLKKRLQALLAIELPTTLVFDHPNVVALAAFLSARVSTVRDKMPRPAGREMPAPDLVGPVDTAALEAGLTRLERLLEGR